MKYKLYFGEQLIGRIEQTDEAFPSLRGKYNIFSSAEEEWNLIFEYVQYSIKASILMEQDRIKWESFIEEEEYKYSTLIESESWTLIDELGEVHKILIPIFHSGNEMTWRWNF